MTIGYFLVADLLGFGAIMRNLDGAARDNRIAGWLSLVDEAAKSVGVDRVQLISDTLFVGTDGSPDHLEKLIRLGQRLLTEGISRALPIRGSICYGEYEWGRLTYGPVVVRAHELEASQDWIGIACDPNIPGTDKLWGYGSLICYPAPVKSGPVVLGPVVDWPVPDPQTLSGAVCRDGLTKAGDIMTWAIGAKLNNTLQFGAYKGLLNRLDKDPRHFIGFLPMDALSLLVGAKPPSA